MGTHAKIGCLFDLLGYVYTPRQGVPPEGFSCDQLFRVAPNCQRHWWNRGLLRRISFLMPWPQQKNGSWWGRLDGSIETFWALNATDISMILADMLFWDCFNLTAQTGWLDHLRYDVDVTRYGVLGARCMRSVSMVQGVEEQLGGIPEFCWKFSWNLQWALLCVAISSLQYRVVSPHLQVDLNWIIIVYNPMNYSYNRYRLYLPWIQVLGASIVMLTNDTIYMLQRDHGPLWINRRGTTLQKLPRPRRVSPSWLSTTWTWTSLGKMCFFFVLNPDRS